MRIAILGATSMLAADYVATVLENGSAGQFTLFARDPARAHEAMVRRHVAVPPRCQPLDRFGAGDWDAVINFIGVGDPARAVRMGADILRLTRRWDEAVLDYIEDRPHCRYLFLSSGAAFGENVAAPLDRATRAAFPINDLTPAHWYGIAKFYAEAVHRAVSDRSIIDIRIFNYVSEYVDLGHRFLISEVLRAVVEQDVLSVDPRDMQRDYLGRQDFARLIAACLAAPDGTNRAVDAHSRAPISKRDLLDLFHDRFGLRYEVTGGGIDATGRKSAYFSRSGAAAELGFEPRHSSADTLIDVAAKILAA